MTDQDTTPGDGRNFDDLVERLASRVHAGIKGRVRLAASLRQLRTALPALSSSAHRVLDVGAGLGQVACEFAGEGHQVTALDISERMISEIRKRAQQGSFDVHCLHGSLQSRHAELMSDEGGFELVCCHAALEWMRDPQDALALLCELVESRGHLSLLFYNNAALVHRNLLRGNFNRARAEGRGGTEGGLTPSHALEYDEVCRWLNASGLRVVQAFGVRAILDFLPREMVEARGIESLTELEQWLEQREPHWRLARYIHIIAGR